jgi:hypothetical protein
MKTKKPQTHKKIFNSKVNKNTEKFSIVIIQFNNYNFRLLFKINGEFNE